MSGTFREWQMAPMASRMHRSEQRQRNWESQHKKGSFLRGLAYHAKERALSCITERVETKDKYNGICIIKKAHWSWVIMNQRQMKAGERESLEFVRTILGRVDSAINSNGRVTRKEEQILRALQEVVLTWSESPSSLPVSPLKYRASEKFLNELVPSYTEYSAIVKTVRQRSRL